MTDRFLPTSLRRALERDIKEARKIAEEGAADAIRRLGVADLEAPAHLSDADKAARRRLRAHARALGDTITDGIHTVDHLIEAAAYAQWHRRLFARFLAERGLLRHPGHGVAVTLEEAEELAAEEGFVDGWSAAESYAARMLPAVFQPEDPVLALTLAPEHAQALRKLVLGLAAETFQAEDSLGWTYQFWRALEKERVNRSGDKIGARELPAVTQLFTEPYMVKFLLHNTLGAWRAGKVLAARPELATGADEEALRAAVSPPGYKFDMLRFVREGDDGPWAPAAGTFSGWPDKAANIRALDPCCGSGHFLTELLSILAALRADEEGTAEASAVAAVLRDNLFGLEIDGRCVQIAAFAVALTAWRIGGFQAFSAEQVHVAWVGAPPPLDRAEFLALANGDGDLREGLAGLHDLFNRAPLLGSLIDPLGGDLISPQRLGRIGPLLDRLVDRTRSAEPERAEGAVAAKGMADASAILSSKFTLVATNVPFLGAGEQCAELRQFISSAFKSGKTDLATSMMLRCLRLLAPDGVIASVSKQEWLFLGSFADFRHNILEASSIGFIANFGEEAWQAFGMRGPLATLSAIQAVKPADDVTYFSVDATHLPTIPEKVRFAIDGEINVVNQRKQGSNPGALISSTDVDYSAVLGNKALSAQGLVTRDNPRYTRRFWEIAAPSKAWEYFLSSPDSDDLFSGRSQVIRWDSGKGSLHIEGLAHNFPASRITSRKGVVISQVRGFRVSWYGGEIFNDGCVPIVAISDDDAPAITTFVKSPDFTTSVRKVTKALRVTNDYFLKVPFDLTRWKAAADDAFPTGFPLPYSTDPTQWVFHGLPSEADLGAQLHVALARLVGYRWPAESDAGMLLSSKARECVDLAGRLPASDADGILPLSAVGSERPLADRLREYMDVAVPGWDEARLIREADEWIDKKSGKDLSLEGWLRDRAFRQHSALFNNRPFLWQVWDGQKDGFSAFLHYHRLDHAALQKLTYTLLGAWITRREAENDDRRVEAAKVLKQKLEMILEGEAPYDIFVRWKPLVQQPFRWNPDLDDGVRLNIRPWVQAGVLREAGPKGIKWGADRGKDVASAPWFKLDKGERNNDRHTTLAEKQGARDTAAAKVAKA